MRVKRTTRRVQQLLAVFFTVVMVSSLAAGGVAGSTILDDVDDDEVEPADEIYVTDDGAVLVYEDEHGEEITSLSAGADVGTGLVNGVLEWEDEEVEDIDGELGAELEEDLLTGSADLVLHDTGDFDEFSMTAEGEHTRENSEFDTELAIELDDEGFYPEATTDGEIVVESDRFTADTSFMMDYGFGGSEMPDEQLHMTVEEHGNGYSVSVSEDRTVSAWQEDQWNTEEAAVATIEDQYAVTATEMGADLDVEVHSYEYVKGDDSELNELSIEYTVELTNIETTVGELLAEDLANDPAFDVSEEDAEAIGEAFEEIHIEEIQFSLVESDGELSVDVGVAIEGYEDAMLEYMNAVADEDEVVTPEMVEEWETTLEAQSEADMKQTITWGGQVAPRSNGADVTASMAYDTENWDAYVTELEDRGIDHEVEATFDGSIETNDDQIDVDVTFEVNQDDLIDETVDELLSMAQDSPDTSEDELRFLEAFDDSDIEVAKTDIVFGDDTVEVRAAGQFTDLSEFADASDGMPDDMAFEHAYGENDGDTSPLYVYVTAPDASAEQFSESAFADEETEVHAEGEWDRDFPRMDTEEVANYLGVDLDDSSEDDDDSLPGFGVGVALLSILGAALLARRTQN